MSPKFIVAEANKIYKSGNFIAAKSLYKKASEIYGEHLFLANIALCDKHVLKETADKLRIKLKEKNLKILKSLYWSNYKARRFDIAAIALERIVSLGVKGEAAERWNQDAEKRLKNHFTGFSIVLNRLQKRSEALYTPIKGRVAYFLHNSLPYSSGGYATRAHGLAQGLTGLGYEVMCVTRPGFPLDTPGDHLGKVVPCEDIVDGIAYFRIFEPLRKNINGNVYMLEAANSIRDFLKKNRVEFVMAASNHLTAIPAAIAAREVGIPIFYEVRGFWEVTRVSREPAYAMTPQYAGQVENETAAALYADSVFTLTLPMKEELIQRGIDEEKIILLPNSCDPTRFTPRERDHQLATQLNIPQDVPVIGYIGSFVQYEGLENLAQACAILVQNGIDFRLLLVGNENASGTERGPITEEIIRIANEHNLSDKLIMPGRVPHDQVEAYYSLIDIAPFPRKPQPVTEMVSPMKPLEALAMHKAILVSSVRALAEMVVDGKTGLIFEKGNISDLAEKLEILISNKSLRKSLGEEGRRWVEAERTWVKTASIASDVISKFVLK